MDIISSVNSAFTQFQRFSQMSVSTGDGHSRVGFRERESGSMGQLEGGHGKARHERMDSPGKSRHGRMDAPADTVRDAVKTAVSYDRSESGALKLRTQEGDVVKLKFLNSESFNAQNQQFEDGGNVLSNFSMEGSNSSKFKVVVEGDLNGAELSAIRDVLIQAREMADTFYGGDVKEAFAMASELNIDSEQLATVDVQMRLRENYTYALAGSSSQNPYNPPVVPPSDQTLPVSPVIDSAQPAAPTVAPTVAQTPPADMSAPVSQPNVTATAPSVSEPVANGITQETPFTPENLVHAAPDSVDNMAGVLSTITNFLNQLTESLNSFGSASDQNSSSPFSFSGGFKLQMMSVMVAQIESTSDEREFSGHALAAATINEVAMQMDASVDDLA